MLADMIDPNLERWEDVDALVPAVGEHRLAKKVLPAGGRLLRTHEPRRNEYHRAIYVVRPPADVVVSYHAYRVGLGEFKGSLPDFVSIWLSDRVDGYGEWGCHVASWLTDQQDTCVVSYDDLKDDTHGTLDRVARFVGLDPSRDRLARAIERNTAEGMRDRERPVFAETDLVFTQSPLRQTLTDDDRQAVDERYAGARQLLSAAAGH
jgi:hypothetical protein